MPGILISAFDTETFAPVDGKPLFDGYLANTCALVVVLQCSPAHPRTIRGTSMVEQAVPDEAATYWEGNHNVPLHGYVGVADLPVALLEMRTGTFQV